MLPGTENARIVHYAYAIEYDYVPAIQLQASLETQAVAGLYLAGQINGTSGYEEAAGQGLVAGMNAAKFAAGKETVELSRDSSYIGVMIDDLVSKDIVEPYRLFTSRAEYRLRLRQDNADLRLSEFAYQNGLLSEEKYQIFVKYRDKLEAVEKILRKNKLKGKTFWELLKQLKGHFDETAPLPFDTELLELDINSKQDRKIMRQLAVKAHYEGYLNREESSISKLQKLECWKIPADFNYDEITGLRNEAKAKLKQIEPTTLSQASRIDGVTPAELALLQVHLTRLYK
ncbi:MAG: FAD-dependent oxidoreductase, partial [Victivallaceae bacterium]|nr:FAD-dependent oxidoreductase [Victivallaceae bacterium]